MATVSSHALNSVDGTHAAGIAVTLTRFDPSGTRSQVFAVETDAGGRLSEEVTLNPEDTEAQFEFVFQIGDYFEAQGLPERGKKILRDVVIRFSMPDPQACYHIPLMLAPNSYSVWWSS
jgi:5-hydroxyisourate hydrolase